MKLTKTQIKNLQDASKLDLTDYNLNNDIAYMPLLLNILAGLRALMQNDIKLPLSIQDKEYLINKIHELGHDYYFDLDNKTGNIYENLASHRKKRFICNFLLSGKNRYTLAQPLNLFIPEVGVDGYKRSPKFTILQYDKKDKMVKMRIRFYFFMFNKDGRMKDKDGYLEYDFWYSVEAVSIALRGILYADPAIITLNEKQRMAKKNGKNFNKDLADNPDWQLIERFFDQYVGLTFTLDNFSQVDDFLYVFSRAIKEVIPADLIEKHPSDYYDKKLGTYWLNGEKVNELSNDATMIIHTPMSNSHFIHIIDNGNFPVDLTKSVNPMGKKDIGKNLNVLFVNANSHDDYNYASLSTTNLYVLSDLTKAEYEAGLVYIMILRLNDLLDCKINLASVHAQDIFRLIYLQQQELNYTLKKDTPLEDEKSYVKKLKAEFSNAFLIFLSHFGLDADAYSDLNLTVKRFDDYLEDLLNDRPIDNEIFNLIADTGKQKLGDGEVIALKQAKQLGINQKLQTASEEEENDLKNKFPRSVQKRITHIFKINDNTDLARYRHIKRDLVHGTKSGSVFSILHEGLLDYQTLMREHNSHFSYTGSGLGNGIYFAWINQSQKSINYASTNHSYAPVYLFVCDVGYDYEKTTGSYGYYSMRGKQNLLVGHNVGSYDRDEIVAKSGKQVKMRYLIEFDKYNN